MLVRIVVMAFAIAVLSKPVLGQANVSSVAGLIQRFFPSQASLFVLNIESVTNIGSTGSFFIAGVTCPLNSTYTCVSISGSDPVAVASGFHYYLKYVAGCSISWWGDQLQCLPESGPIPIPASVIYQETSYDIRYYMNVCTFGYSTFAWDWPRWEREIDWMALNSINTPLAFVGQEYIMQEVLLAFNFTYDEIAASFSGPAMLPWYRMANLQSWLGPLPQSWISQQMTLQLQILERMRSFGMRPILPAFNGLVPPATSLHYPNASVYQTYGWNGLPATYMVEPTDPLFEQLQLAFIAKQTQVYGTDHLYSCDLYNEMEPRTNNTEYLSNSTLGVYSTLNKADPLAVWVMQGWMFLSEPWFWGQPQIRAVLEAAPPGRMIILDLASDTSPVWTLTDSYYNRSFVWNMLHNFGGRSGLYGKLATIATGPALALVQNGTTGALVGIGLTPEAIETNPIVYDMMMENTWRGTEGILDVPSWVTQYVSRRYHGSIPDTIQAAWQILASTVYNCSTEQEGTSGSIFAALPDFEIGGVSCCAPLDPYYNTSLLRDALAMFVEGGLAAGPALTNQPTFQFDIVTLTSQVMSNYGIELHQNAIDAYNNNSIPIFNSSMNTFLDLILEMDALVGTQELFLFGKWIYNATRWGTNTSDVNPSCDMLRGRQQCGPQGVTADDCELLNCCFNNTGYFEPQCFYNNLTDVGILEWNARTQVTLWASQSGQLSEYAYKLWNGLLSDYYHYRWQTWTRDVLSVMEYDLSFNEGQFWSDMEFWEESWTRRSGNPYMLEPQGNAFDIAASIFMNYFQ